MTENVNREWKQLDKKQIYQNPWTEFYEDKVIRPDGKEGIYGYVVAIDGLYIIPFDGENVYLISEYRYPIKEEILQFPGGRVNNGQETLEVAQNELKQEIGINGFDYKYLGNFYIAASYETTIVHFYTCSVSEIDEFSLQNQEGDESITKILKVSIPELKQMVLENKIKDVQSVAAIAVFLLHMEKKQNVIL